MASNETNPTKENAMFGYTYKLAATNKEGVVKLTPTLSTYAKAFGPVLVIWGLVGAAVAAQERQSRKSLNTLDPED
jgi:ABC-type hemin transport system substrate-binding protein